MEADLQKLLDRSYELRDGHYLWQGGSEEYEGGHINYWIY